MIMDKETQLVTTVALDLGSIRPGPGIPIKLMGVGLTADVTVTHGDAEAAADPLMTVTVEDTNVMEFELPSTTKRFIKATFPAGTLAVTLCGNQTAR